MEMMILYCSVSTKRALNKYKEEKTLAANKQIGMNENQKIQ
jgi:hypothetical protein